jgi:four helix bundle protein
MATITKFEELEIWQLARELANDIFELYTNSEDFSRDFKLRDQINGSIGSVMDNIAEGFERGGRNVPIAIGIINFLTYSKGSAGEVKSQLYRALDRKYITREKFDRLYEKTDLIGKKTGSFINYLNTSPHKGNKFKNRKN